MASMKPKVRTTRALAAYTAARSLRLVSIILLVVFIVVIVLVWLLATQVSSWWWVILLPVAIIGAIILLVRFVIQRIIRAVYPHPISQSQRQSLDALTEKVTRLAATRSTPLPLLAFLTVKDIIVHRDATTIRGLFNDSKALSSDLRDLENEFKDR